MAAEPELHYFCKPAGTRAVALAVDFLPVQEFLADELGCKELWELLSTQFHTRGKFLAVWPGVRYVALHRDPDGRPAGILLVTTPVTWQIDYVVVRDDRRQRGIAAALVQETLNRAYAHKAPYVMLTSRASLRPMYEKFGFRVVEAGVPG